MAASGGRRPLRLQCRRRLAGGRLTSDTITAVAYGDTRDVETGKRKVAVRNMRFSTSFDLHPRDRLSSFASGTAESNYQQRFQSRLSAGWGAKLTLWQSPGVVNGYVQDASVSLAVLAEKTTTLPDAPPSVMAKAGRHARWSLRLRCRKRVSEGIRFSHLTLYQPTMDYPGNYTLEALTEVAMPLRAQWQFTVSHRERLDSEARKRGAASIQDGQVLSGIRATFQPLVRQRFS